MARLAGFRKKVIEGWTVQRIAAVLIVAGGIVGIGGFANQYCTEWCGWMPSAPLLLNDFLGDFYANIAVDCLSIAFAILVIDRLNERRAERELKAQLIREMGSKDNGTALRAAKELEAHRWTKDGSLRELFFLDANLQGIRLSDADLQKIDLSYSNLRDASFIRANLQGARFFNVNLQAAILFSCNLKGAISLTEQQLATLSQLAGTTLPDGTRYDGRFNLSGDIERAARIKIATPQDAEAIAGYYGVSLEEYLDGQKWAREHLADLRHQAGLDPDTGLPLEPTNGIEPQPVDAPAQPAPRRNGHTASMVAHQVRR